MQHPSACCQYKTMCILHNKNKVYGPPNAQQDLRQSCGSADTPRQPRGGSIGHGMRGSRSYPIPGASSSADVPTHKTHAWRPTTDLISPWTLSKALVHACCAQPPPKATLNASRPTWRKQHLAGVTVHKMHAQRPVIDHCGVAKVLPVRGGCPEGARARRPPQSTLLVANPAKRSVEEPSTGKRAANAPANKVRVSVVMWRNFCRCVVAARRALGRSQAPSAHFARHDRF